MDKISTGIKKLDSIIGGGFHRKSTTLIAGPPVTGKTTMCLQFLYNGAIYSNSPAILVTFEEFPEIIYRDALNFGWDFRRLEDEKKLKIIFTSPEILQMELEKTGGFFDRIVDENNPEIIAFDSISNLKMLYKEPFSLRNHYNSILNSCRRLNLTSVYTYDVPRLFSHENLLNSPLAYAVDNVFFLQYVEAGSKIDMAMVALKIRGSTHSLDILSYEIGNNGFLIKDKFINRENILSGSSRLIMMPEKKL